MAQRQMKLATRIGCGFGTLVVISAVLGYISWTGLRGVSTNQGVFGERKSLPEQYEQVRHASAGF